MTLNLWWNEPASLPADSVMGAEMIDPQQRNRKPGSISITVYGTPVPQGSMKAFVIAGRARVTSDNRKLKPYRQEVSGCAVKALEDAGIEGVFAGKHVPVEVTFRFFLERPPSIPKKRVCHVVKPDLDKLVRATSDALTGIFYADDAQIVGHPGTGKFYGTPARAEITVRLVEPTGSEK